MRIFKGFLAVVMAILCTQNVMAASRATPQSAKVSVENEIDALAKEIIPIAGGHGVEEAADELFRTMRLALRKKATHQREKQGPMLHLLLLLNKILAGCKTLALTEPQKTALIVLCKKHNLTEQKCADVARALVVRCEQLNNKEVAQVFEAEMSEPGYEKCYWSLLHFAAMSGSEEFVDSLLRLAAAKKRDIAALINKQDCNGNSPLHVACEYDNVAAVRSIVCCKEAGVNMKNDVNSTPLWVAISSKRAAVIQELLRSSRVDLEVSSCECDCPPLAGAILQGSLEIVHMLVRAGCRVSVRSKNSSNAPLVKLIKACMEQQQTPDMWEAMGVYCMMARYLVDAGSCLEWQCQRDEDIAVGFWRLSRKRPEDQWFEKVWNYCAGVAASPLQIAAACKSVTIDEIAESLQKYTGEHLLFKAMNSENCRAFQVLLGLMKQSGKYGDYANTTSRDSKSLLACAIEVLDRDSLAIQCLEQYGICIGAVRMIYLLLQHGADMKHQSVETAINEKSNLNLKYAIVFIKKMVDKENDAMQQQVAEAERQRQAAAPVVGVPIKIVKRNEDVLKEAAQCSAQKVALGAAAAEQTLFVADSEDVFAPVDNQPTAVCSSADQVFSVISEAAAAELQSDAMLANSVATTSPQPFVCASASRSVSPQVDSKNNTAPTKIAGASPVVTTSPQPPAVARTVSPQAGKKKDKSPNAATPVFAAYTQTTEPCFLWVQSGQPRTQENAVMIKISREARVGNCKQIACTQEALDRLQRIMQIDCLEEQDEFIFATQKNSRCRNGVVRLSSTVKDQLACWMRDSGKPCVAGDDINHACTVQIFNQALLCGCAYLQRNMAADDGRISLLIVASVERTMPACFASQCLPVNFITICFNLDDESIGECYHYCAQQKHPRDVLEDGQCKYKVEPVTVKIGVDEINGNFVLSFDHDFQGSMRQLLRERAFSEVSDA